MENNNTNQQTQMNNNQQTVQPQAQQQTQQIPHQQPFFSNAGFGPQQVPPVSYSAQGPSYYGYAGQVPQQFNYSYNNNQQKKYNNQPLTAEQINALRRVASDNIWEITEEEKLKYRCTHRDRNGDFTLSTDADGYVVCSICGAKFKPYEGSLDDIRAFYAQFNDIFNTAKTLYDKASPTFIAEYSKIGPLMKRLVNFFEMAQRCLGEQDMNGSIYGNPQMTPVYGYNCWSALGQLQGVQYPQQQMYYPQQQQYYPQQQPMYQQPATVVEGAQNPMVNYNPVPVSDNQTQNPQTPTEQGNVRQPFKL